MTPFVPANQLYDVDSRTPIAHPAIQATDDDIRCALEAFDGREVRTDGGCSSSGTEHLSVEEAEDLLRDATSNIRRVKNDYPNLTDELDSLLNVVDGHLTCVYLRLGREDEDPPLTELADRSLHTDAEPQNGGESA